MKEYGINYLYLSQKHAGGKDQVGLNLLKGFYETGQYKKMLVICYDYSENEIRNIAKDIDLYIVKSHQIKNELARLFWLEYDNTFLIPQIIKKKNLKLIFHLSINNGWRKYKCRTILLPHDIKAISHRRLPGLKISVYKYLLYKLIYYRDFKHADNIIAISDCDKEEIQKFYPRFADKVFRIYNPIVFKEFSLKSRIIQETYIVAVNVQFLHKNIITLIKAYEKINNQIQQKLVLVGSIPKRVEFLKEYVKNHNLENKVIFTGFVTEEEMYRWMINADLYVNPTLFEGFGMTAVEAMSLKVPTLVSKIPVNYEVTEGYCFYYEPADAVDELAKKILMILSGKMPESKDVSNIILNKYGYYQISKEYVSLFESVCK